jgi:hypothetical protein
VEIFQYLWVYQKVIVLFNPVSRYDEATDVPGSPGGGGNPLRNPEIGNLQKRELKVVVLADGHQRHCGVDTLQTDV